MKKIASLFFSLALVSSVVAGPVDYDTKSTKDTKNIQVPPPLPPTCFGPGFDLGLFAGGRLPSHNGHGHGGGDGMGGGVEGEYFFNDFVGIQASYGAYAPNPVHHNYEGDLVLRYPFQSACIAPYLLVGGGGVVDGYDLGFFDVGAGIEARFPSFNKLGVFLDGTYHFVSGGGNAYGNRDYTLVRLGFKFLF